MTNRLIIAIVAMLILAASMFPTSAFGAETTSEHTIVGIFEPGREADLKRVLEVIPEIHLVSLDIAKARVTLRYDIPALFSDRNQRNPPKPSEVETRLSNLLSNASESTFSLKPLSTIAPEKLERAEIRIGILDCKGCRYGAYQVAMRVEGVQTALVGKTLNVSFDPQKTDVAAIEAALKKGNVEVIKDK